MFFCRSFFIFCTIINFFFISYSSDATEIPLTKTLPTLVSKFQFYAEHYDLTSHQKLPEPHAWPGSIACQVVMDPFLKYGILPKALNKGLAELAKDFLFNSVAPLGVTPISSPDPEYIRDRWLKTVEKANIKEKYYLKHYINIDRLDLRKYPYLNGAMNALQVAAAMMHEYGNDQPFYINPDFEKIALLFEYDCPIAGKIKVSYYSLFHNILGTADEFFKKGCKDPIFLMNHHTLDSVLNDYVYEIQQKQKINTPMDIAKNLMNITPKDDLILMIEDLIVSGKVEAPWVANYLKNNKQ